ncbi:hypothetical protein BGZ83_010359 [Gryganskiella cystojenkinii]|nr:hypothetical protein BGZ83_010359 [Gryganskiella cystojenkinii]
MDSDHALQAAKKAAGTVYHWIFDGLNAQAAAPVVDTSAKARLLSPSSVAASMASQAASFASSYVNSYLRGGEKAGNTHSSSGGAHRETVNYCEDKTAHGGHGNLEGASKDILSTIFQTLRGGNGDHGSSSSLISSWKHWDPSTTFDNLLWNYTPDVHTLMDRIGLTSLAEKYEIEPLVVLFALVLPLIMLSLCACVLLVPNSENLPPGPPGRKSDPRLVGGKQGRSSSAGTSKQGGQGSSSSSKVTSKKGKGTSGGAQDASESNVGNNVQLGNGLGLGKAWGSMLLASAGFLGPDTLDLAPYGGLKGKNIGELIDGNVSVSASKANARSSGSANKAKSSTSATGSTARSHPKSNKQEAKASNDGAPAAQAHYSVGSIVDMEIKKAQAESEKKAHKAEAQHTEPGHESVFKKNNVAHKGEHTGHQWSHVVAGSDGLDSHGDAQKGVIDGTAHPTNPLRTRAVDRPGSAGTETQKKHVANDKDHHGEAASAHSTTATASKAHHGNHATVGRDLGSKILGFAQGSQLLRNMDTFSGGILGSAVATVAALANTAEATAAMMKDNLPDSVTDFTDELQGAFDHAMKTGGLDPRTYADVARQAEDSNNWGIRQAVSRIMDDDDKIAAEKSHRAQQQQTSGKAVNATRSVRSVPISSSGRVQSTTTQKQGAAGAAPARRRSTTEDISVGPNVARHIKTAEERVASASESEDDTVSTHSNVHSAFDKKSLSAIDRTLSKAATASSKSATNEGSNADADEYILESGSDSSHGDDSDDLDDDENADDGSAAAHHVHHHHTRVHPHDTHHVTPGHLDVGHLIVNPKHASSASSKKIKKGGKKQRRQQEKNSKHQQEFTIDENGNKVQTAVEDRRDSGFDAMSQVHV